MSFLNKVVIITGASSGIGAATAVLFAKEGADVVIVGRNDNKLKKVSATCEEVGKNPLKVIADVSKDEEAASIIDQTIKTFGKIDVLINNAGILLLGKVLDGTIMNVFDELIRTNLRSVIYLTTLATPHLIKTKGNVINISSAGGYKVIKNVFFLPYTLSKNSVNIFSQGAAIELAPLGVTVNTISPGPVKSNIWNTSNIPLEEATKDCQCRSALNRISEPEEIANLALYLAGDKAIGITGSNFVADNGFVLLS